jgi:predicted nucleic acid-binding protein
LNSSSAVQRSLRRLKPEKHTSSLRPRDRSSLSFLDPIRQPSHKLLLDTTVYVDALQSRLPQSADLVIPASEIWHSTVTESELAALLGLLNPRHKDSSEAIKQVMAVLENRPAHRTLNPDAEVWREAGILAGMLARLQGYGNTERRRALNDALILLSAAKKGCTVLTRNVADFDFLMQLAPFGKVLFYDIS